MLASNASVWFASKITNGNRMPVIASGRGGVGVHTLLDDGPLTMSGHDEGMKVQLKTIADSIVVDPCSQTAATYERVAVQRNVVGVSAQLVRRFT